MPKKNDVVRVRVTEHERAAWEAAARIAPHSTLSEWLRRLANDASSGEPDKTGGSSPRPGSPRTSRVACINERHHRPGAFCKTCGKSF